MNCSAVQLAVQAPACRSAATRPQHLAARPQRQKHLARSPRLRVSAAAEASPVVGAPQQQHVIKMVNLVTTYFGTLLTEGDMSVMNDVLDKSISHKDMVRNIGRVGIKEYTAYLEDLHRTYPDYYVKPVSFGIADTRTMFVSFEGQVSAKQPKFSGVDLFLFNADATKITEVQVYRSSWLGAAGHEERKKLAEAAARVEAQQAAVRGQLP